MLSKILTGTFILIMVGAVIAGAIAVFGAEEAHASVRATEQETFLSQGQGQGRGQEAQSYGQDRKDQGQGRGQGGQGYGQGQESQSTGQGQGRGVGTAAEAVPVETEVIEGVVVETDELFIETADDETVQVGLGPSAYREAQGFVLQVGENVRVSGYWQDGEFKALQLENLTTGQSIVLRDSAGRPMWAGQGRGRNR